MPNRILDSPFRIAQRECFFVLFLLAPLTLKSQAYSPMAEPKTNPPNLKIIVQSLDEARQRDSALLRPHRVTREYKVFHNDNKQPISEITAQISFIPGSKNTYQITHSSGSSRTEKIVRRILDRETKSTKNNHYSDINERNYEFVFLRQENLDGHPTYVLRLIPRKKEKELLNGLAWVDEKTFRIWRIEGVPARKPSWWIKKLHITMRFAEIDGMWLHTSLEVTAFVRFFGKYVLTGRDVGLQTAASKH